MAVRSMKGMTETVQLELRDDATAVLRLNRPEVHNAVDVVDRGRLMDEADAWARTIAAHPPSAVRAVLELDGDAEQETRLFGELWSGESLGMIK